MTYAFRLREGDDLLESIRTFAAEHAIAAAVVLSSVGCVRRSVVRDATGVRVNTFTGRQEILSLNGTVSAERTHLHISLADEEMRVIGGHLCEGTIVNTTCEVVLLSLDGLRFEKEFDPQTGYNELRITEI